MKKKLLLIGISILIIGCNPIKFQTVYDGYSNKGKHSRGLTQAHNAIIAVSGSDGSYALFDLRSNNWIRKDSVADMEDFRGVHMRTNCSLVLINSGTKGQIWSVTNSGEQKLNYDSLSVFLDGISFYPNNDFEGVAYGDPIDSTFLVYRTMNGGHTWHQISSKRLPVILPNEAGFAASGTGIQTPERDVIFIGTGVADTARILRSFNGGKSWDVKNTPMKSGDHYGIYSMYFTTKDTGFVIGGSYKDSTYNERICYYTKDSGNTWGNRSEGLPGYMSCIYGSSDLSLIVATGRMGAYYSLNRGKTWSVLTEKAYYSCLITNSAIILSGRNGIFQVIKYSIKK